MSEMFPKLTVVLRSNALGYEGSYACYQVTESGTMHAFGIPTRENTGLLSNPVPIIRRFNTYEAAVAAVDALIENRCEDIDDYGPMMTVVLRNEL